MKAPFPANVCRGGCKRLQERLQCFASEMGKAGTEIVCPIMYKRKGEERFTIWGTVVLPGNLLNRFDVGPCMIYDKCGKKQTKVAPCANNLRL